MRELLQRYLHSLGLYSGKFDGVVGPQTQQAISALFERVGLRATGWNSDRRLVAAMQLMAEVAGIDVGKIDGYNGPQTRQALATYAAMRLGTPLPTRPGGTETSYPSSSSVWPPYAELESFYGPPGGPACTAGKVKPPYRMVLAWATSTEVRTISCHEKVAPSLERVLGRIKGTHSPEKIRELGLHLFGGCFNLRKMRGGTSWSTHAWGIALDWDPLRNALTMHAPQARLSRPDAEPLWRIWEEEGWISLGRARDYDWMHVQACGL